MCWPTHVDSYRPPAPRYAKTTRYARRYSPSPPPVRRIERTYIRRAPSPLPLPPPAPALVASTAPPPPPVSVYPPSTKAPSAPSAAPSAAKSKTPSVAHSAAKSKAPSVAPSAAKSKAPTEAPAPPAGSNAGSKKSQAIYVEVTNEEEDDASSASSGLKSGSKSNHTHTSRRSSAPPTEYSVHEKEREIRRYVRPINDWETYRYVDAPAPPSAHSRHRSASGRRDSGAPRDDYDRELKISIKR